MIRTVFILAIFINVAWTEAKSCSNITEIDKMVDGITVSCKFKIQRKQLLSKSSGTEYDREECNEDFRNCVMNCLDIGRHNNTEVECGTFADMGVHFASDKEMANKYLVPSVRKCCMAINIPENKEKDKVKEFFDCVAKANKERCEEDSKFLEDQVTVFYQKQSDICDVSQ